MKIKHKLTLGYLIATSIVFIVAFAGIHKFWSIHEEIHKVNDQTMPVIEALENLRFAGLRIVSSTSEFGFINNEKQRISQEREENWLTEGEEEEERLIAEGIASYLDSIEEYERLINLYGSIIYIVFKKFYLHASIPEFKV